MFTKSLKGMSLGFTDASGSIQSGGIVTTVLWHRTVSHVIIVMVMVNNSAQLSLPPQCHVTYIHDDAIKWKHFPHYWPFVRGIHRSPVNSPHKGPWRGALVLSLICAWTNGWVNNRDAGYLKRHGVHYDVTVMRKSVCLDPRRWPSEETTRSSFRRLRFLKLTRPPSISNINPFPMVGPPANVHGVLNSSPVGETGNCDTPDTSSAASSSEYKSPLRIMVLIFGIHCQQSI